MKRTLAALAALLVTVAVASPANAGLLNKPLVHCNDGGDMQVDLPRSGDLPGRYDVVYVQVGVWKAVANTWRFVVASPVLRSYDLFAGWTSPDGTNRAYSFGFTISASGYWHAGFRYALGSRGRWSNWESAGDHLTEIDQWGSLHAQRAQWCTYT